MGLKFLPFLWRTLLRVDLGTFGSPASANIVLLVFPANSKRNGEFDACFVQFVALTIRHQTSFSLVKDPPNISLMFLDDALSVVPWLVRMFP